MTCQSHIRICGRTLEHSTVQNIQNGHNFNLLHYYSLCKNSFDGFPFLLFSPYKFPVATPTTQQSLQQSFMLFDLCNLTSRLPKRTRHKSASLFTPLQEIWDLHHVWKTWKTSCHSNGALIVIYHGTISKNSPTKRQKSTNIETKLGTFIHTLMQKLWRPSFLPILSPPRAPPTNRLNCLIRIVMEYQSLHPPEKREFLWISFFKVTSFGVVRDRFRSEVTSISGIKRSRWRIWELQSEQMKLKLHLVFCPKDPKGFRVYLFFFRYRTFKLRFRGLRTAVCDGLNMALHLYIACKHE